MKSLIKLSLLALISMGGVEGSAAAENPSEGNVSDLPSVRVEERLNTPSSNQTSWPTVRMNLQRSLSLPSLRRSDQGEIEFFPLPRVASDESLGEAVETPIKSYQNNTINVRITMDGQPASRCDKCLKDVEVIMILNNIQASDKYSLGHQIIAALKSQLIFNTQDIKPESAKLYLTMWDEATSHILTLLAMEVRDLDAQVNYSAAIWRTVGRSADAVLFMIGKGLVSLTATFDTLIARDSVASLADRIDLSLSSGVFLEHCADEDEPSENPDEDQESEEEPMV